MPRPPGTEAPRLHPIAPIRRPPNITKIGAVVINTAHHPQRPPLRNRLMPSPIIKSRRRRHHKIPILPIRRPPNIILYSSILVTAPNHPQTALMRNQLITSTVPLKARRSRHQNPTRPIRRPPNIRAVAIDWRKPITPPSPTDCRRTKPPDDCIASQTNPLPVSPPANPFHPPKPKHHQD